MQRSSTLAKLGNLPISTLLFLFIILVFASQYGFSFERGNANTEVGFSGAGIISSLTSGELFILKVQALFVYATLVLTIGRNIGTVLQTVLNYIPLCVLVLWTITSTLWSQAPMHTLVGSAMISIDVAFAAYLVNRFEPESTMKLIAVAGVIAVVSSLFLVVALPQYGIQSKGDGYLGAWQGIFGSKNFLGQELTCMALPAFFLDIRGILWKIALLGYTVVIILMTIMSQSSGSIILLASTLVFVVLIKVLSRMSARESSLIAVMIALAAGLGAIACFELRDVLLPLIGKSSTMTGRTVIWGSLIVSLLKSPFLGYGYDSFWVSLKESANVAATMGTAKLGYAENGLLELALGIGVIGLSLYVLAYALAVRYALYCFRRNPSKQVLWYISILFVAAITNIASGYTFSYTNLQTFLPIVAFFGLRREYQRARVSIEPMPQREMLVPAAQNLVTSVGSQLGHSKLR